MPCIHKKSSHQHDQLQQQPEELIFYTNQLYSIFNAILHFLQFLFILGSGIIATMDVSPTENVKDNLLLCFWFFLTLFIGWRTWKAISQILVRKPLLLINHLGIFVYDFPRIDAFDRHSSLHSRTGYLDPPHASLLWKDIASITATGRLTVLPKNVAPQGKHYFKTKAFTVRTGEPLSVPQRYSDCPFEEVLWQIRSTYGRKLKRYQIEM